MKPIKELLAICEAADMGLLYVKDFRIAFTPDSVKKILVALQEARDTLASATDDHVMRICHCRICKGLSRIDELFKGIKEEPTQDRGAG